MVLAILQARVSSTRLPGKVLRPVLGVPMILRQVERIRRAKKIDQLVIATSLDRSDDALEHACRNAGVECHRGSLDDVLDRFYQAAIKYKPTHIVRLTGDCPLTDPALIDQVIEMHIKNGNDYSSNNQEPTFPDGLDAEVVKFEVLETAWKNAQMKSQREHVTLYIYQNKEQFKIQCLKGDRDLSSLRWTVDEPEDFAFVTQVYEALYPHKPEFATADILKYLAEHPDLSGMNSRYMRNEGLQKSLKNDAIVQLKKD